VRRLLLLALLTSIGVATMGVTAHPAAAVAIYFGTPDDAAYCGMGPDSPHQSSQEYIHCFTPDDGFSVSMGKLSRPQKAYYADYKGQYVHPYKRLGFGQTWRWHGFSCTSRATGLTCTNPGGHGWWLGRFRGYRLF
jgi:hypothetical protein